MTRSLLLTLLCLCAAGCYKKRCTECRADWQTINGVWCSAPGYRYDWWEDHQMKIGKCLPCSQAVSPEALFVCFGVTSTAKGPRP